MEITDGLDEAVNLFISSDIFTKVALHSFSWIEYYGYKTQDPNLMDAPGNSFLIVGIETKWNNFYIGMDVLDIGYPQNSTEIQDFAVEKNLNKLLKKFNIQNIQNNFREIYLNFDQEFKDKLFAANLSYN